VEHLSPGSFLFSLLCEIGGIKFNGIDISVTFSLSLSGDELPLFGITNCRPPLAIAGSATELYLSLRYITKWGSQGSMASPKNVDAVTRPSFETIQSSNLHEMDPDQAGGQASSSNGRQAPKKEGACGGRVVSRVPARLLGTWIIAKPPACRWRWLAYVLLSGHLGPFLFSSGTGLEYSSIHFS
jgi:hypothetical protein